MRLITALLTALVCSALFLSASALSCQRSDFDAFKTRFGKSYDTPAEDARRFAIFCGNLQRYDQLNQAGGATYGATKFSDQTKAEFSQLLGYRPSANKAHLKETTRPLMDFGAAPKTFDWRTHKPAVLTPVYNQGQCGSCWAFSATENIESQWALAGNKLTKLSMQQIVDCDSTDGGCNGGNTDTAYEYVITAGGLEPLKDYPYTAQNGQCQFEKSKIAASIVGWEYTGKGNEKKMVTALATKGPISICVDASSWDGYQGGIVKASACGNQLDHCVLAVGYDLNKKYWIVRNSWGTDWGVENGFIYLQYGKNTCGISDEPTCSAVKKSSATNATESA